ncbi:Hypothetical protein SRAE_1000167400 [Strongyloides ratti]|uniref:Uncharacterized protein n=1 Tax=Strongyloides ratti TaxID=34506 RepID=A0A090L5L9_STRRB|nr:Hypothetical protein SRAE_1000167400 [Strongyloides ratti]CEF63412.1 Hypothetical protein SRAE_1000167400 [Strongyloides ratti]
MISTTLIVAASKYEWDSERQAAARFLTEKIFGAVLNYNITEALYLANNANISKFKTKKQGKYNKKFLKNKWDGISKKKYTNGDSYERKNLEKKQNKHINTVFNHVKYTNENKIKRFGNFKSPSFLDNTPILKKEKIISDRFIINPISNKKQKMIKVEGEYNKYFY